MVSQSNSVIYIFYIIYMLLFDCRWFFCTVSEIQGECCLSLHIKLLDSNSFPVMKCSDSWWRLQRVLHYITVSIQRITNLTNFSQNLKVVSVMINTIELDMLTMFQQCKCLLEFPGPDQPYLSGNTTKLHCGIQVHTNYKTSLTDTYLSNL